MLIDILFYILFLLASIYVIERSCKKEREFASKSFLYFLFFYRIIFTLFYPLYYGNRIDSMDYFQDATQSANQSFDLAEGFGTAFITFITKVVSHEIGLSYIATFFFFSFFGFLAWKNIYILISKYIMCSYNLGSNNQLKLLFFFPTFHLWSINLGKDPLVLYGISLCLYFLFNQSLKNLIILILGFSLVSFIRPHIGFSLLICIILFIFLGSRKIHLAFKLILVTLSIVLLIKSIPFILEYSGLGENPLENYALLSKRYSNFFESTGASIDMSDYSIPFKLFTFLYRPLFIDIPNAFSIITSCENLLLLIFSVRLVFSRIFYKLIFMQNLIYRFSLFYILLSSLILVHTGNNLGTFSRYRNVIIPFILILFAAYLNLKKQKNERNVFATNG